MRSRLFIRSLLCAFFLAAFAFTVRASDERILSFQSMIQVHPDAGMTVTENIRVMAAGDRIKRGIYRDFPTSYSDRSGQRYDVGFRVREVLRDGQPEPYHQVSLSNGQRVYIGDQYHEISPGLYNYTIVYDTDRQLGFFTGSDELYWNVTGNGWEFAIGRAVAVIELPAGATVLKTKGWTGPQGSREDAVAISRDEQGRVVFETTRPLGAGEGLTIAVAWPKGHVQAPGMPSPQELERQEQARARAQAQMIERERGAIGTALVFFLGIMAYFILAWALFGKDPARGTIIPLFEPPARMSPAMVRYIYKMGYDNKAFAAVIVGLAVRGYYRIQDQLPGYLLVKTGKDVPTLFPEELVVQRMTMATDSFRISSACYEGIQEAIAGVKKSLQDQEHSAYFLLNRGYFFIGFIPSVIFLLYSIVWAVTGDAAFFWTVIFDAVLVAVNILFFMLLRAPTVSGRRVMDQIEGFRLFLSVTERDEIRSMKSPELTPQLFEKFFPYAVALDVEQKWFARFADVFAQLKQQGVAYYPQWCDGGLFHEHDTGGLTHFGSSMSHVISSASVPPGSSSAFGDSGDSSSFADGFSGGGCSGGGGGGGGGGGW